MEDARKSLAEKLTSVLEAHPRYLSARLLVREDGQSREILRVEQSGDGKKPVSFTIEPNGKRTTVTHRLVANLSDRAAQGMTDHAPA